MGRPRFWDYASRNRGSQVDGEGGGGPVRRGETTRGKCTASFVEAGQRYSGRSPATRAGRTKRACLRAPTGCCYGKSRPGVESGRKPCLAGRRYENRTGGWSVRLGSDAFRRDGLRG